jgi:hypothetical protein
MPDFNVRSDSVNVEQIMEQIRARIREKRGVDYTEQQIRELAAVKLEKFLDPRGVRSDLLNEFRRGEPDPNYAFEDDTLFVSTRGIVVWMRRMLAPVLKLFFNPNPLIHVLHMQSQINDLNASRHQLYYELIHNLVVETTRLGIEVKNLKMRVESLDARVDFSERRARALEGAVLYRPQAEDLEDARRPAQAERGSVRPTPVPAFAAQTNQNPAGSPASAGAAMQSPGQESAGQRSRRRRRRRGRRGGGSAAAMLGSPGQQDSAPPPSGETDSAASGSESEFHADAESQSFPVDSDPSTGSGQDPSTGSGQDPSTGSGQDPSTGSGQDPSTGSGHPSTGSGQGEPDDKQ